jgi:ATP-binding protein involved in chromosome partitioning
MDEKEQASGCGGCAKGSAGQRQGAASAGHHKEQDGLRRVKNVVAVASGKGGVGKSTVAVNLAYGLAAAGAKVGILDADIYGPSVVKMTGITVESLWQDEQTGMVIPPEHENVKLISSAMFMKPTEAAILRAPMVSEMVRQFLSDVDWGELDYLIIDYPPGTGDIQLTLSQTAPLKGAIVVTTPQEVALDDARKAIVMFSTLNVPVIGIAETMSYFICDGCDKKHAIFREGGGARLAAEFGAQLLCQIPLTSEVALASDSGRPLIKNKDTISAAKEAFGVLVHKFEQEINVRNSAGEAPVTGFKLNW